MTGYQSKRAAAQDKLKCQCSMTTRLVGSGCQYCNPEYMDDDDAQPEQEPVAWLDTEWGDRICPEVGYEATITEDHPRNLGWIPLYATPPQREWVMQREWVDLTDEEIDKWTPEIHGVIREVIAQFKEKNNG